MNLEKILNINEDSLDVLHHFQDILAQHEDHVKSKHFVRIDVVNSDGDVTSDIKKALSEDKIKANCEWEGHQGYRGTNYIYVYGKIFDKYQEIIINILKQYDVDNSPEIKDFR